MNMYPFCSPTGAGYTPNKAYADRMEELRAEYIEACKDKDIDAQIEIRDREKNLSLLINDVNARMRQGMERYPEMPPQQFRIIRVTAYTAQANKLFVVLDVAEVEAVSEPIQAPLSYTIHMRSGQKWDVGEDDFNEIERILYSRRS